MATKRDYYDVLGVAKDAQPEEVKRAYRKKAKEFHPDTLHARFPELSEDALKAKIASAEESFKEISEAYEVLADQDKRARYDRFGHAGAGFEGGFEWSQFSHRSDLEDLFGGATSDMFGGSLFDILFGGSSRGPRRGGPSRGQHLQVHHELTLQEAAQGKQVTIEYQRHSPCRACGGTRGAPGKPPVPCATCSGTGQQQRVLAQGGLRMVQTIPCQSCRGQGEVLTNPCPTCRGAGQQQETKKLQVPIPPGIEGQTRVRISGEGEPGARGGPPGDLYVLVLVTADPRFHREGPHLLTVVEVPFPTMVLGGEVEVPTLDGVANVTLAAATQPGTRLRLRGKGMPVLQGRGTGDLLVEVQVQVPEHLNREQKAALKAFAHTLVSTEEGDDAQGSKGRGFFDRFARPSGVQDE